MKNHNINETLRKYTAGELTQEEANAAAAEDEALSEILEAARAHMAVVTDKENKFLGIITMEDIIAELMKS